MRSRPFKLLLLLLAVGGGVKLWQQKQQSSATHPSMGDAAATSPTTAAARTSTAVRPADSVPSSSNGASGAPNRLGQASPFVDPMADDEAADQDSEADAGSDDIEPLPDPPRGPFATAPDGPPDDLKRISGVGPKLEAMLNEQGITTFAQLAALDEEGVDALQARLPQFPGRIRRDDWVGQATRLIEADNGR